MLEVADLIRLHEGAFRARFGSRLSSAQWRALAISKPVERPTLEAISNSVLTASTPVGARRSWPTWDAISFVSP